MKGSMDESISWLENKMSERWKFTRFGSQCLGDKEEELKKVWQWTGSFWGFGFLISEKLLVIILQLRAKDTDSLKLFFFFSMKKISDPSNNKVCSQKWVPQISSSFQVFSLGTEN